MALLWTDGFDLYGTYDTVIEDALEARGYTFGNISFDDDTGRISGKSLEMSSSYTPITSPTLDTTNDTFIFGFGFKTDDVTPTNNNNGSLIAFNNGTDYIDLEITTDSKLNINVGGTNLAQSTNTISVDTWYFVEWKFTIGSNAAYEVKVDGETWISGNGDTQAGSVSYYNQIKIHNVDGYDGGQKMWYDDLFVMDATGSTNNDFVGDCKIVTIQPDGDDSCNFANLSTGSDHYALVDDDPFDGDSTYVEDATSGNRDLFTYGNTSDANTIYGLSVITAGKRTDTDAISIKTVISSNGTVETGSNFALDTAYSSGLEISEEDPDTSNAWTQSGVNAAKFGFEVV